MRIDKVDAVMACLIAINAYFYLNFIRLHIGQSPEWWGAFTRASIFVLVVRLGTSLLKTWGSNDN